MRERINVPVPRPISSPSLSTSRDSATMTRLLPLTHLPSATTSPSFTGLVKCRLKLVVSRKAVGRKGVGRVERSIVEHLEIDRPVRRACRVVDIFSNKQMSALKGPHL